MKYICSNCLLFLFDAFVTLIACYQILLDSNLQGSDGQIPEESCR